MQLRLTRASRFSILEILLLNNDKSVNLVNLSNPSITVILLNERSKRERERG